MNVAEFALKKTVIALSITMVMVVAGVISFMNLSRLEDPEFTIKDAKVVTYYAGARPEEVEREVTDKIETAIQQMGQLKRIKSESREGVSIITPTIKDQYDKSSLPQVWDELRRKVGDMQKDLPPGVTPTVINDDFGDVYGVFFAVTAEGFDYKELKKYIDFLKREFLLVQDVAKVDTWGLQQEVIYLEASREKLAALGISHDAFYEILAKHNIVTSAGNVPVGDEYINIAVSGNFDAVTDIENLVITDNNTKRVFRLKDIATVKRDYETPPTSLMRYNGVRSVGIGISTIKGGNVVKMGEALTKRMQALEKRSPLGLKFHPIYIQSEIVRDSVNGFMLSLTEAIVIVIAILLIFMGLRSGLIIGVILFVNIMMTFPFMSLFGTAMERISLGALIIALGMLVDNAIVITDGILVRINQGKDRTQSAITVVNQNMWPLFGATIVGILAFALVSMSQDSTGEYTRSLFTVICISLGLSWILAVTLTPYLCVRYILVTR